MNKNVYLCSSVFLSRFESDLNQGEDGLPRKFQILACLPLRTTLLLRLTFPQINILLHDYVIANTAFGFLVLLFSLF